MLVSLSEWGSPGDKWARTRAFPGIISARKLFPGELLRLQRALIVRLVLRVNWWRVLEEVEVS